ncbi:unnamed protein product [Rhizophagus irregularis]|nr:unnamed protein product [Rhizophagus irregularis]CAB5379898.1 unnamed protein product [Rhizophagus irregularis]
MGEEDVEVVFMSEVIRNRQQQERKPQDQYQQYYQNGITRSSSRTACTRFITTTWTGAPGMHPVLPPYDPTNNHVKNLPIVLPCLD